MTMENKYKEKTGMPFDETSNIGINISILAEYLSMMYDKVDSVKKQAFFATATGKYLDEHGKIRGLNRRKGKKGVGEITFYRDNVSNKKILLPKGIMCETSTLLEERFITTEDKILDIGENFINIMAESVDIGERKNMPPGKIDTMVSSLFGIKNIVNLKSFSSGADEENDDMYRQRIINHYASCSNGANLGFYENICLSYDEVSDASVKTNQNEITGYLKFFNHIDTSAIDLIQNHINDVKEIGKKINIHPAKEKLINFDIKIVVNNSDKKQESIDNLKNNINVYVNRLKIGETIYLAQIINIALFDENILDIKILSHSDNIFSENEEYFKVDILKIS